MRKKVILLSILVSFSSLILGQQVKAESESLSGNGSIQFEASLEPPQVIDPEDPKKPVDPGPSPSTDGYLRIDFVPKLNFGRNKLSQKDQVYPVNAQLFHGDTNARGNYIQVTDSRATGDGWTIQVRQETAFTSNTNDTLKGAYISLDKAWANSTMDKQYAPSLQTDVIKLDKVGTTYNLATAGKNQGYGTWAIEFGASDENEAGLQSTLTPLKDEAGKPVLDVTYENKQIYKNNAINFFMPGSNTTKPGQYQTVMTWILSELP
ncbi:MULTISPECIES: WxL domain-containing protein [unclassified Enterococcus]|uniref:WxL domain-containing protein n=1 Tax=unclassified Enterococcus TaxID=2608891 RepID=UPI001CE0E2CD|nr:MULTISPECIES: WxL domain-containing protein [unclassified Enterococcus]MCA5011429.1 WxL domain-containing protein [Enterococcus sp. S23]MCA5015129.1 WxL domain-containing protein [Enterococcus sp. S22(2020)]